MATQSPALEKLFDAWTQKHKENLSQEAPYFMTAEPPYGNFVRDGIINMDMWRKQKVRICFILNEAGGYEDTEAYPNGHDLTAEWNEKGSFTKFMFKLAVWTRAINDAFVAPVTYSKKQVVKTKDDLIRSIAIVNLKKSDGHKYQNYDLVNKFAMADAEEIRAELDLLKANIIICCGNFYSIYGRRPGEVANPGNAEGAETIESAPNLFAAPAPAPEPDPNEKRQRAFYFGELTPICKFTYAWDKRLIFNLWSPMQFNNPFTSNTINYYSVRGIVRSGLKAFGQRK